LALATRADKLSRTFFDSLDRAPLSASDSWTLSDLLKDFLLNQNPTPRTEGEETSGYLYSELNGSDTAEFIRTTITLCLAETISDDLVENPPKDLEVFLKLLKRDKEKDSEFMTQLRETEGRARRYTFLADYADQRHSYP